MSKFQGFPADPRPDGFKTGADEDAHRGDMAFRAECAKVGISDAPNVRPGGYAAELHDQRKTVRRAVNKITEGIGMAAPTDSQLLALQHAGVLVAKIDGMLDGMPPDRDAAASEWHDSSGRSLKLLRTSQDFRSHYKAERAGEERMTLVDWVRGVANMPTTPEVRNALSEGTNTAGGFTVPSVVMPQILDALVPASSLLQAGMPIVPLDTGAKSYTTAILSGVPTAAWRAESGAVAESDPVFSGVVAAAQSLSFYFKISRELLSDSPNIEAALLTAIGQAMAKALDAAGLRGTGTPPTPRGILNTSGIQAVTNGANGASLATTAYTNFISAVQALLAADAPMPTAAIMSPRSLTTLAGLLDTTNQPRRRPEMLNMPFLSTSQIPINLTVGTSTDCSEIYLGDFSRMAMILREGLSVQLLSELYAGTGQLAFMCHSRADFAVMYPSAFAVVTGVRA